MATTAFGFPFSVNPDGAIVPDTTGDASLRGEIVQVLFTAPGERVNNPEFGCGLFNLVFDPSNTIMAAALEFTVGAALTRWLGDRLFVQGVNVTTGDETISVEVAYTSRADLTPQVVSIRFQ
jgi:phage baseplate assembly protein W